MKTTKERICEFYNVINSKDISDMSTDSFVKMLKNVNKSKEVYDKVMDSFKVSEETLLTDKVKAANDKLTLHDQAASEKAGKDDERYLKGNELQEAMDLVRSYRAKSDAYKLSVMREEADIEFEKIPVEDFLKYRDVVVKGGKGDDSTERKLNHVELAIIYEFVVS